MRITFLLILLPFLLKAQSGITTNPDIVWAKQLEQDLNLDMSGYAQEAEAGVSTLKILQLNPVMFNDLAPNLSDLVVTAAQNNKLAIFKDKNCQVPAKLADYFTAIDTVVAFDPSTYEETVKIVQTVSGRHFKGWRLRQILAYNQKTANYTTEVQAIAPLVVDRNKAGDSIGLKPLFWFKPGNERQDLRNNDIVWAKQVRNVQPGAQISTDNDQVLKTVKGFETPWGHLFNAIKTNPKLPIYDAQNENPLLTAVSRDFLAETIDTIVMWGETPQTEVTKYVHNKLEIKDLKTLKSIQTWYWDDRRSQLFISLDAVAPMLAVRDNDGSFIFNKPLFYRRSL